MSICLLKKNTNKIFLKKENDIVFHNVFHILSV